VTEYNSNRSSTYAAGSSQTATSNHRGEEDGSTGPNPMTGSNRPSREGQTGQTSEEERAGGIGVVEVTTAFGTGMKITDRESDGQGGSRESRWARK
jgi:hypothetical protein